MRKSYKYPEDINTYFSWISYSSTLLYGKIYLEGGVIGESQKGLNPSYTLKKFRTVYEYRIYSFKNPHKQESEGGRSGDLGDQACSLCLFITRLSSNVYQFRPHSNDIANSCFHKIAL
ncbi:hypothetical protein CEXT_53801 [Caerostris extrusa]|uniref:Uncharacterized protein n=1 Tax=Caerostris extrusa TaxID=172846 RepID=A0AAV4V925_CAEEX|nr:hypothetical protein CEXT_53801 [Caerostris extrusa]